MDQDLNTNHTHSSQLVDLVDKTGQVTGSKLRKEIRKESDIYHAVYVLLITPDQQAVLSVIPARGDLPNLYVDQLGITAATIRRHDETAAAAAGRAAKNELGLKDPVLECIGEDFLTFSDGRQTYISVFSTTGNPPSNFNRADIAEITLVPLVDLDRQIQDNEDKFAPSFHAVWAKYKDRLISNHRAR